MHPPSDPWSAVALAGLFGLLFVLRLRFPNASRRAETAAVAATAVLFFLVCHASLTLREAPDRPAAGVTPAQAGR